MPPTAMAKEEKSGAKQNGMHGTNTDGTMRIQPTQSSLADDGCSMPNAGARMTQREDLTIVDHSVSVQDRDHEQDGAVANALLLRSSNRMPMT